jgi:hypothetical protein
VYTSVMALVASTSPVTTPSKRSSVPLLVNGDRLSRDEFERRYRAMPGVNKAELIEGVVYMPSPVRYESHSKPHMILGAWLVQYVAKTPGLNGYGDNGTVRLDNDNEPQPDLFLLLPQHLGGRAKRTTLPAPRHLFAKWPRQQSASTCITRKTHIAEMACRNTSSGEPKIP